MSFSTSSPPPPALFAEEHSPGSALLESSSSISPRPAVVTDEEVISGRFFLRQLCLIDPFFGMLAEDYMDRVLQDHSTQQSINNWNIVAVCLADHGLMFNDEVLFRLMSGDPELAAGLTEDIHKLKDFQTSHTTGSRAAPRWKVLAASGQKETPLRQRLNPFVQSKETAKPPTAIHIFDADRLGKTRTHVVLQMKDLENKLAKAREKKTYDARAAEAAAQQKMLDEQLSGINMQKSDMLRMLEGLEAKFVADERRIHQMKRLAGTEPMLAPSPTLAASPPPPSSDPSPPPPAAPSSPKRLRDTSKLYGNPKPRQR